MFDKVMSISPQKTTKNIKILFLVPFQNLLFGALKYKYLWNRSSKFKKLILKSSH